MENKEISGTDIFVFIQNNWKTIISIGVAGALLSSMYVFLSPARYEATVMVEMAQTPKLVEMGNVSGKGSMIISPVEPPAILVERLKLPVSYSQEVIKICGNENDPSSVDKLPNMVRVSTIKNYASGVSLTVQHTSPQMAKQCVEALFEMIKAQQAELAKPIHDEIQRMMSEMQEDLRDTYAYSMKVRANQFTQTLHRDEAIYLRRQIGELNRISSQGYQTRLLSPIHASRNKVSPTYGRTLFLGTMAGLMLGILFAMSKKKIRILRGKLKSDVCHQNSLSHSEKAFCQDV